MQAMRTNYDPLDAVAEGLAAMRQHTIRRDNGQTVEQDHALNQFLIANLETVTATMKSFRAMNLSLKGPFGDCCRRQSLPKFRAAQDTLSALLETVGDHLDQRGERALSPLFMRIVRHDQEFMQRSLLQMKRMIDRQVETLEQGETETARSERRDTAVAAASAAASMALPGIFFGAMMKGWAEALQPQKPKPHLTLVIDNTRTIATP